MNFKLILIFSILTINYLPSSDCLRNVSEDVMELKECIEESRLHIEQTISLMREDFRQQLDTVLKDVGYLIRREKMAELCPPRRCIQRRRKCVLSDDMETSHCVCQDGYGGNNCELTAPCLIDQYNYENEHVGQKFPYNCSDNGYYEHIQFNETGGYCVTSFNKIILPGYFIESPEDITPSSCSCALHKYRVPPHFDITVCKSNGEFDKVACREKVCLCQSRFGRLYRQEYNLDDIDQWYSTCEGLYEE